MPNPYLIKKPTHIIVNRAGQEIGRIQVRGTYNRGACINVAGRIKYIEASTVVDSLIGGYSPHQSERIPATREALRFIFGSEFVDSLDYYMCVPAGTKVDPTPAYISEVVDSLGLRVTSYFRPPGADDYMPMDLIGTDGLTHVIYHEPDRQYSVAGWQSWHDGMHGGRSQTLLGALGWVRMAKEVRAGLRTDFGPNGLKKVETV